MALGVFCHLNHHWILLCAKLGSGGVKRVRARSKVTLEELLSSRLSFLHSCSSALLFIFAKRNCLLPSDFRWCLRFKRTIQHEQGYVLVKLENGKVEEYFRDAMVAQRKMQSDDYSLPL